MAVPFRAEFDGTFDKIAFATGYHELDKEVLSTTIRFAKKFDATVYVVHVDVTHTDEMTNAMDRFLEGVEKYDKLVVEVIDDLNIERALADFVDPGKLTPATA